jgi:hypothetical protein
MRRAIFSTTTMMLTMTMLAAAGCVIEVDPDHSTISASPAPPSYPLLADLEVRWSVSGDQGAALCGYYGVGRWIVEVRGPESRDVVVDCWSARWTTGTDLHLLAEGRYTVTLRGLHDSGVQMAARSTSLSLYGDGLVTDVAFTLVPADFLF